MAAFDSEPMDIPPDVKAILPTQFRHQLIKLALKPSMGSEVRFEATFKASITSKESAANWLEEFQTLSLTTWRVHWTYPENSEKIVFKKGYRCHHNTRPSTHKTKNASEKHTNCRASLWISIYHPTKAQRRKGSAYLDFPCVIVLSHTHNHLLASTESLAWRDPGPELKEKFLRLFTQHMPSAALELHKQDLMLEYGDDYPKAVADRGVCPNRMWVYHLYYKTYKAGYCKMHDEEQVVPKLLESVAAYNDRCQWECAKVEANEDYVAVAVCSPLMQRVHEEVPAAAELVCFDSSAHIGDIQGHAFLLMTHSAVGGLPLGALITSSNSEEVLNEALSLFKDILPERAFYGRGTGGPAVLVVGDVAAQRKSLHFAFLQSVGILGIYALLQDVWRLLWDPATEVQEEDRIPLFSIAKALVSSESEDELEASFAAGSASPLVTKYRTFDACYGNLFANRRDWAPCFRSACVERGGETDGLGEIALAVLRDKVLLRTKASNVAQLFCFLSGELDTYYKRKILQLVAGRLESRARQGFIGFGSGKKRQRYEVEDTNDYLVFRVLGEASEEAWVVDAGTWNCSCPVGLSGGACRHQFAVSEQRQLDPKQLLPCELVPDEAVFRYIATGQRFNSVASECSLGSTDEVVVMDAQLEGCSDEFTEDIPATLQDAAAETLERLQRFYERLGSRLCNEPEQLVPALRGFLDRFEGLTSADEIVAALATFRSGSGERLHQNGAHKRKMDSESPAIGHQTIKRVLVLEDLQISGQMSWRRSQTCLSAIRHEHDYC